MRNRFLCALLALCLLMPMLALPAAVAETSTEELLASVRASILERAQSSNTRYELQELVRAENYLDFAVQEYAAFESETQGQQLVYVYVDVACSADASQDYYMGDYDIALCAYSSQDRTEDSFRLYTPSNVFDVTDGRVQELLWPVAVYSDKSYTLCLIYTLPAEVAQVAIVETNMIGGNESGVEAMGPIYSLTVRLNAQPADSSAPETGEPDTDTPTQEPSTL